MNYRYSIDELFDFYSENSVAQARDLRWRDARRLAGALSGGRSNYTSRLNNSNRGVSAPDAGTVEDVAAQT